MALNFPIKYSSTAPIPTVLLVIPKQKFSYELATIKVSVLLN